MFWEISMSKYYVKELISSFSNFSLKKYFHFSHGQSLHNFSMFTYQNSYSTRVHKQWQFKVIYYIFLRLWNRVLNSKEITTKTEKHYFLNISAGNNFGQLRISDRLIIFGQKKIRNFVPPKFLGVNVTQTFLSSFLMSF